METAPLPFDGRAHRRHHLEALRRRAALHQGPVRRLLDERLRALQAEADADADADANANAIGGEPCGVLPLVAHAPASPNPLAVLLAHIAGHGTAPGGVDARTAGRAAPQAHRELRAVRDYRSTWSRLSVEQRVNQALARVPHNAGPLNTQRLLHQTLTVLRDVSPAYMHRLVMQVEALLCLERLGQGAAAGPAKKKSGAGAGAGSTGSSRS